MTTLLGLCAGIHQALFRAVDTRLERRNNQKLRESVASNEAVCFRGLDIAEPHVQLECMKQFTDVLAENQHLSLIALPGNGLEGDCMFWLAAALKNASSLKTLLLYGNSFDGNACQVLCVALARHPLAELDLCRNRIDNVGCWCLAEMLKMENRLRCLKLFHNAIGPNGVWVLCEALKTNGCKLEVLELERNPISADGAGYLGEALRVNVSLLSLNLSFDDIQEAGVGHISDALTVNTSLKVLSMPGVWQSIDGLRSIARGMAVNEEVFDIIGLDGEDGETDLSLFDEIQQVLQRNTPRLPYSLLAQSSKDQQDIIDVSLWSMGGDALCTLQFVMQCSIENMVRSIKDEIIKRTTKSLFVRLRLLVIQSRAVSAWPFSGRLSAGRICSGTFACRCCSR